MPKYRLWLPEWQQHMTEDHARADQALQSFGEKLGENLTFEPTGEASYSLCELESGNGNEIGPYVPIYVAR